MFKWFSKNLCCCIPKKNTPTEKSILVKNNNNKQNKKNKKNDITVSFDTNTKYLQNITYKETEIFIPQIRFAKVVKVYDGDTITVAAKLPFNESPIYRFSVRLRSIDSPEIKGESEKECQLAIESRDALHNLIFDKIIELRHNGKEKYGRLLADLYYKDLHINKWMVDNGYAVKYDGGKKISFTKT
jgi:micrococcal nuclease